MMVYETPKKFHMTVIFSQNFLQAIFGHAALPYCKASIARLSLVVFILLIVIFFLERQPYKLCKTLMTGSG